MLKLSFKQTRSELMVRAAATILFNSLSRNRTNEVKVADLTERPQYGFTASATTEPVGPKFVRITDLQDGKIEWDNVPFCECLEPAKYLLQDNDILFARTGATTGKTHLVHNPQPSVFASYLIRLRPKSNVEAGYLHAFFQSENYWSQIAEEKEGSAQPNVNGDKLSRLKIPFAERGLQRAIADFLACVRQRQDGKSVPLPELPMPLAEQQRIVAQIEELAAKINEARGLRQQIMETELLALRNAIVPRLFGGTWPSVRLEELCSLITDGTHQTPRYVDNGFMFLSAQNVKPFRFMPENHRTVSAEDYRACIVRAKPQKGDVLMTRVGAMIGESAVIDRDLDFAFYVSLAIMRPLVEKLLPEFLVHWLNSPGGLAQSRRQTLGKGHSQGNLNLKLLRGFDIPLPPLSEQRRIVTELDALRKRFEALKKLQADTSTELDALLPSVLDKAFRGEL